MNFNDLSAFKSGFPDREFALLRQHDPVYWNHDDKAEVGLSGYWIITKHSDIVAIEKAPDMVSSRTGLTLANAPSASSGPPWSMIRDALFNLDTPRHTEVRKMVAPPFTRKAIEKLAGNIRQIARELLDSLPAEGGFDFVERIALPYPMRIVVTEVLGIPKTDHAKIAQWNEIISTAGNSRSARMVEGRVISEFYQYGKDLFLRARQEEPHNVLSVLAHTRLADGQLLDEDLFLSCLWTLLTGAFESTTATISGGLHALTMFTDEYLRLLETPGLLHTAVDEMLRWETPLIYVKKTAKKDFTLRGKTIKSGQTVILCYASGNRDEEVFAAADQFQATRSPNPHLSFGVGSHFCLGANLVRLELMILFEEMLMRGMKFSVERDVERRGSNFENRIKRMRISRDFCWKGIE